MGSNLNGYVHVPIKLAEAKCLYNKEFQCCSVTIESSLKATIKSPSFYKLLHVTISWISKLRFLTQSILPRQVCSTMRNAISWWYNFKTAWQKISRRVNQGRRSKYIGMHSFIGMQFVSVSSVALLALLDLPPLRYNVVCTARNSRFNSSIYRSIIHSAHFSRIYVHRISRYGKGMSRKVVRAGLSKVNGLDCLECPV